MEAEVQEKRRKSLIYRISLINAVFFIKFYFLLKN